MKKYIKHLKHFTIKIYQKKYCLYNEAVFRVKHSLKRITRNQLNNKTSPLKHSPFYLSPKKKEKKIGDKIPMGIAKMEIFPSVKPVN